MLMALKSNRTKQSVISQIAAVATLAIVHLRQFELTKNFTTPSVIITSWHLFAQNTFLGEQLISRD